MRDASTESSNAHVKRPFSERLAGASLSVLVVVLNSCGGSPPAAPASTTTAKTSFHPTPTAILESDVANAVDVRQRFGLRADEAWVRSVAADPMALTPAEWGIPLLPPEIADLMSRRWPVGLLKQVRAYGLQFPEDFATAYSNLQGSGVIVQFKQNVAEHRAALAKMPFEGPVEVVQAAWSLKELEGFLEEVNGERRWLESLGARFVESSVQELENVVSLRYEGPMGLENLISGHFGRPSWLQVQWAGPGPWNGPRGDLVVQIRDARGGPVGGVWCELIPNDRRADEGFGETLFTAGDDGNCIIKNLPAVGYEVRLHRFVQQDHYDKVPFAEARVQVTTLGTVITIRAP